MDLYFAYGSNMRSARLFERIGPVRVVGPARLPGFTLCFDKPGRDGTAKANVRPNVEQSVYGVIWVLPPDAFAVLDGFEAGYERTSLQVVTEAGRRLVATTYGYQGEAFRGDPSDEYVRHLIDGALEHALPVQLVARLEAMSAQKGSASAET